MPVEGRCTTWAQPGHNLGETAGELVGDVLPRVRYGARVTFDYLFGGLSIGSSLPFDGLRKGRPVGDARPDIMVTSGIGAAPEPDREHFAWPGRYGLTLGEYRGQWLMRSAFDGSFLIARDGTSIQVFCDHLPPGQALTDVLVRRILPRVTILFGANAIHSAALAGQDGGQGGGLMLLGRSGAGKSTLTAALAHFLGWEILSDDISILRGDSLPMLAPAATGVCLWPPSRDGLGLAPEHCAEMPGYDGKLRYDPYRGDSHPTPLRAFVFLDRAADCTSPRLEQLSLAQGVAEIVPQIIRFNPHGSSATERVTALETLVPIMRSTPVWRLTYPASYAALSTVSEVISGLIAPPH